MRLRFSLTFYCGTLGKHFSLWILTKHEKTLESKGSLKVKNLSTSPGQEKAFLSVKFLYDLHLVDIFNISCNTKIFCKHCCKQFLVATGFSWIGRRKPVSPTFTQLLITSLSHSLKKESKRGRLGLFYRVNRTEAKYVKQEYALTCGGECLPLCSG